MIAPAVATPLKSCRGDLLCPFLSPTQVRKDKPQVHPGSGLGALAKSNHP
jgi:hypothetical protein